MSEGQDTEITLGTGRLLGLFFGLVIVCAIFFGLGFSLGRNSVKAGPLTMEETPLVTTPSSNTAQKIAAGTPEKTTPAPDNSQTATGDSAQSAAPVVQSPGQSTPSDTSAASTPAPEINKGTPLMSAGAYTVQVAAVSKQEDADALVSALRKKSYPVFIASNAPDKLFHVQIGPFQDIKDAEAMKTKLTGDGYNPIVKR